MAEQQPPADEQPQGSPPQPAPGVVPPGYPPSGMMPPPGYSYPAPPPYGTMPPTGYPAYSQGYYYPPGSVPVYAPPPPPREYAVPPAQPGQPWQIVPPTRGTLFQAWVSVGTRLTRQNIAAWAQASQKGWAAWSIVTYLILTVLPFLAAAIVGAFISPSIAQNIATASGQTISASDLQALQIGFAVAAAVIAIVVPLFGLGSQYAIVFFWALFMPQGLGTIRERMSRAIKPYALALPATGLAAFIVATISFSSVAYILSIVNYASFASNAPQIPPALGIVLPVFFLIATAAEVYTISLLVQSGSVGTTLNRWAVFGIDLLAGLIFGFAIDVLFFIGGTILSIVVSASRPAGLHLLVPAMHVVASVLNRP
jgi:hypothetical protein